MNATLPPSMPASVHRRAVRGEPCFADRWAQAANRFPLEDSRRRHAANRPSDADNWWRSTTIETCTAAIDRVPWTNGGDRLPVGGVMETIRRDHRSLFRVTRPSCRDTGRIGRETRTIDGEKRRIRRHRGSFVACTSTMGSVSLPIVAHTAPTCRVSKKIGVESMPNSPSTNSFRRRASEDWRMHADERILTAANWNRDAARWRRHASDCRMAGHDFPGALSSIRRATDTLAIIDGGSRRTRTFRETLSTESAHRATISLGLPEKVADFIGYSKDVAEKMTDDPASPDPRDRELWLRHGVRWSASVRIFCAARAGAPSGRLSRSASSRGSGAEGRRVRNGL